MGFLDIESVKAELLQVSPFVIEGKVIAAAGPLIKAELVGAAIGDVVYVENGANGRVKAKVVAYDGNRYMLSAFSKSSTILSTSRVIYDGFRPKIKLGSHLLGSITDCLGKVLRTSDTVNSSGVWQDLRIAPPDSLTRTHIAKQLTTGIRAIDGILAIGKGQRLAVFAEPGVGKSTLIAAVANNADSDINVIALVGERGREVLDLVDHALSADAKAKTVIVVSTSNEPAVARMTAAHTATRIAEYFREQGKHVLLQIDSLTRLFRAYREVGLAAGEAPVRRGYPPSVFAELPDLIERAGASANGSITALYTVLLSSDLDEDPMVEEIKGLTDGHIILRKALAEQGHYPAIDVVSSLSRLAPDIVEKDQLAASRNVVRLLARAEKDKDIIALGGKVDPELEKALAAEPKIYQFLAQDKDENSAISETRSRLFELANNI